MSKEKTGKPKSKAAQLQHAGTGGQDTRQAILDAAVKLFLQEGYQGFSLRQVARAIGYTPTTIYLYFNDKDDLLFHVVMEGFRNFGHLLASAYQSASTPLERLKAIGEAYIQFGLDHPLHYRLMFMERGEFLQRRPPEGFEAPIDSFGILLQTVTECVESGLIKPGDPMVYAFAVWSTVHGLVALAITNPFMLPEAVQAIRDVVADMVLSGLRA